MHGTSQAEYFERQIGSNRRQLWAVALEAIEISAANLYQVHATEPVSKKLLRLQKRVQNVFALCACAADGGCHVYVQRKTFVHHPSLSPERMSFLRRNMVVSRFRRN